MCDTEEGLKSIREYWGSPVKLEEQKKLLSRCRDNGFFMVDQILVNKEGETVTMGEDNVPYMVKDWYLGKECDTRLEESVRKSMKAMADLHSVLKDESKSREGENLLQECRKHNQELRRVRKYLQGKKKKNIFEERMAAGISVFIDQGEQTAEALEKSGYEQLLAEKREDICHGECNQHNIIFTEKGIAFVNFEHWKRELQTWDICHFMRKILEKNRWDIEMGKEMLRAYHKEKNLTGDEMENLRLQLAYPWKYWKMANFYTGSNKVWVSRKNLEKLEQTTELIKPWKVFLKEFSCSSLL